MVTLGKVLGTSLEVGRCGYEGDTEQRWLAYRVMVTLGSGCRADVNHWLMKDPERRLDSMITLWKLVKWGTYRGW